MLQHQQQEFSQSGGFRATRPGTAPANPNIKVPFEAALSPGEGVGVRSGTADSHLRASAVQAADDEIGDEASIHSMESMPEGQIQASYKAWAEAVFAVADYDGSGELTANELKSMLHGTEHMGFVEWLFFHRDAMFRLLDKDGSGSLGPPELARALHLFHTHVSRDESQPLKDETGNMLVARKMLEHMYRHSTPDSPPSFLTMFEKVDTSGDGAISFLEMEKMMRAHLKIGTRKVSFEQLKAFYAAIDVDRSFSITKTEFHHFMLKMSAIVSKCFVTFPPPPQGMLTWDEAEPHDNIGRDYDFGEARAPWLIPKSYEEMVRLNRTWRVIGEFSSLSKHGVTLPPRPDDNKFPREPPLPTPYQALKTQIRKDVALKEKQENTMWNLSGPRYQITQMPLEEYHTGRNAAQAHGGTLFSYPTRLGGSRLRHHDPLRTPHGVPLGKHEQLFADQKAAAHGAEPLFMQTLPATTGVYDRLCNVTTTSKLFGKMAYADELRASSKSHSKRKGSAKGFVPL